MSKDLTCQPQDKRNSLPEENGIQGRPGPSGK